MAKIKTPEKVQKLETAAQFAKHAKEQPGVVVVQEDACGITIQANGQQVRMSNDRYPLTDAEKQSRIRTFARLGLLAIGFIAVIIIALNIAIATAI